MFFQLLYIHLFRPFLKYSQATSPLPPNVSPRRLCTQAAAMVSKLMRLYRRSHGLRQICNVAVYILHTACTIHLLNLPDKNSKRDITHGLKHLEEIAESWLCARRTLAILSEISKKWKVELPEEAEAILGRTQSKYGTWGDMQTRASNQRRGSAIASPVSSLQNILPQTPGKYFTENHPHGMSAGGGAEIGRPNSNNTLPPQNAAELQRARSYNQTTPQSNTNTSGSRTSVDSTSVPGGESPSPSALFGGVDQLLRDSQDWWLKDQSQLAMGFEQWPAVEGEWLAGTTSPIGASTNSILPGVNNGINGTMAPNGNMSYATDNGGYSRNSSVSNMANGNGPVNNLGGFGVIQGYANENDWYS